MTKLNYKFQYEEWHQDTEESRNSDVAASADFINLHGLWPKNKDANILDVGCGMGRFLLAFRGNGYANLSGIDVDDYQIGIAKKEGLDVNLVDATKFFGHNKKQILQTNMSIVTVSVSLRLFCLTQAFFI